jgi:uncharacterized iron-regulated membrane protein
VLEHLALFFLSQLYYYSVRLPFRGSGRRRKRIQEREERRKKDARRLLLLSMCGVSASSFPAAGLSILSMLDIDLAALHTAPQHYTPPMSILQR